MELPTGYITAYEWAIKHGKKPKAGQHRAALIPGAKKVYNPHEGANMWAVPEDTPWRGPYNNLSGQRLGRLKVLCPTDQRTRQGSVIYECRCDCGEIVLISSSNLRIQQSCGCLLREKASRGRDGVYPSVKNGTIKYRSIVSFEGDYYYLGYFDDMAAAATASELAREIIKVNYQNPDQCKKLLRQLRSSDQRTR